MVTFKFLIMPNHNDHNAPMYGTTNVGYGTTNADAGVGIGMLKGIRKFENKNNELADKAIY